MADIYVWSGATGTGTGASWANAFTTLVASVASRAAGDKIWVAHDHNEVTLGTFTATYAVQVSVTCVDRGGSVPPSIPTDLRDTAIISNNVAGSTTMAIGNQPAAGVCEFYGLNFKCGNSTFNVTMAVCGTNQAETIFTKCTFQIGTSAATGTVSFGTSSCFIVLNDCWVKFNNTAHKVNLFTAIGRWVGGGLMAGSTIPVQFFALSQGWWHMEGLDLSAVNTVLFSGGPTVGFTAVLKDCLLHASVNPDNMASIVPDVTIIRSGKMTEHYARNGQQTMNTTTYLSGGASHDGTPFSWLLTNNRALAVKSMYQAVPISAWNVDTGTKTLTVEGSWSGGSPPTNDDIYMDVTYIGTGGKSLNATTKKPTLAAPNTSYPSSTATWVNGSTTKFKMTTTFDADINGPVVVTIFVLKPSSSFYIDPKPVIV